MSGALKPRNDVIIQTLHPEKGLLKNQIIYPPILVEDFVEERKKLHYPQYLKDKSEAAEGKNAPEFIQEIQKNIKNYNIWIKIEENKVFVPFFV